MTTKNMAIVSLVCGIVGIVGSFIPYVSYVAPLCAIAGIVFGALALKNIKAGNTARVTRRVLQPQVLYSVSFLPLFLFLCSLALSALYVQQLPLSLLLQTADLS